MQPILPCSPTHPVARNAPGGSLGPLRPLIIGLLVVAAGCGDDRQADVTGEPSSFLPANSVGREGCGFDGRVQATVYGALDGSVDWTSDAMDCEGMPRPDGDGVRLRFAGSADAVPLAIIIGVDGIGPDETGEELQTNVTIIEEGRGRFFSTSDLDSCWTDIERQAIIDADSGRYAIDGTLYCISPLAEVNGSGSVSVPELRFSGLVDWGPS